MNDKAASGTHSRLYFIDHLRAFLVILVVVHHSAMVYGGTAPFYYTEPTSDSTIMVTSLVFLLVNQSWFMGAFFLLAGYFTPGSFERKGAAAFLKDRFLRLGVPLLLFVFVLNPLASIGTYQVPTHVSGLHTSLNWQTYPQLLAMGPMWFAALLLIFTCVYTAWQVIRNRQKSKEAHGAFELTYTKIILFIVALSFITYFIRRELPLGQEILGFPTLAYLPQYLSFFVLGIVAYHNNWFQTLTVSRGGVGFATALAASVLLFPLAFSGHWFSLSLTPVLTNAMGYGQWQSAIYALWDSIFAVGMSIAVISLSRHLWNRETSCGRFLSQQSFTVYVIHIPVLVFLALGIRDLALPSLSKFGFATILTVPSSFVVAYIIRKLPMFSKIF